MLSSSLASYIWSVLSTKYFINIYKSPPDLPMPRYFQVQYLFDNADACLPLTKDYLPPSPCPKTGIILALLLTVLAFSPAGKGRGEAGNVAPLYSTARVCFVMPT